MLRHRRSEWALAAWLITRPAAPRREAHSYGSGCARTHRPSSSSLAIPPGAEPEPGSPSFAPWHAACTRGTAGRVCRACIRAFHTLGARRIPCTQDAGPGSPAHRPACSSPLCTGGDLRLAHRESEHDLQAGSTLTVRPAPEAEPTRPVAGVAPAPAPGSPRPVAPSDDGAPGPATAAASAGSLRSAAEAAGRHGEDVAQTAWRQGGPTEPGAGPDNAHLHGGPVSAASFPELIGRIVNDASDLVDKQIELAKQEVREDISEAIGDVKQLAIGAGIGAAAGLLLVIALWTALIWFFNWLGGLISPALGWLGWPIGLLVPAAIAFFAYRRFIKRGLQITRIRPMARTRATLKEDMEWVQHLRTPSAK